MSETCGFWLLLSSSEKKVNCLVLGLSNRGQRGKSRQSRRHENAQRRSSQGRGERRKRRESAPATKAVVTMRAEVGREGACERVNSREVSGRAKRGESRGEEEGRGGGREREEKRRAKGDITQEDGPAPGAAAAAAMPGDASWNCTPDVVSPPV